MCEEHFEKHTRRLADGRYIVKLPFKKEELPAMGSSKQCALRRFTHLERKLELNTKLREDYTKCINEYEELHHMEEVDVAKDAVLQTQKHYFVPHHAVIKEASSTTKLRVVFDAAAKTRDGSSLNDKLFIGPKLQTNIIDLLMRWRTFRVTFTADIEKMYRQISVTPEDRYYQLILWREHVGLPIRVFKLKTVTFGTACAPYLAIRVLKRLCQDEEENFPVGARVVRDDMYVDDLISGADTIGEAKLKRDESRRLLSSAGFHLRKWTSNEKEMLADIPVRDREVDFDLPFESEPTVKTLGIKWFPNGDYFSFQNIEEDHRKVTRRTMLSAIAKLFDPLGWISPCVVTAKMMMQHLWDGQASWDDPVPSALQHEWEAFRRELPQIQRIKIPRWIHTTKRKKEVQLHGFCDASEKAYGGAVYVRCLDEDGMIHINLLISKTKVAPNKRMVSLPRLELCGAVLVAELLSFTQKVLEVPTEKVFAWTDSMIALAWIQGTPSKWTTFVANRVSEVGRLVPADCWRHVSTEQNPADLASRGVYPSAMETLTLWWNGPQFLKDSWSFDCPNQPKEFETTEEERGVRVHTVQVEDTDPVLKLIYKSSRLLRAIRVIATCRRFVSNCRKPKEFQNYEPMKPKELEEGLILAVKAAQREMYKEEIMQITEDGRVPKALRALNAFVDADGILRVGGRLANSLLSYDAQHPMILQGSHHFTKLVVRNAHKCTLHGGLQQTMAYIRERFWIGQMRRCVKFRLHKCVDCFRQKAEGMKQLMGNLPAPRVRMARPFVHAGVDYAGPIEIKSWKARSAKIIKGYFAVFICLVTKAIHLEVVSDLTTQAFLAAFKRFTARRGVCTRLHSDCGTNFVGANAELGKMLKSAQHCWKEVAEELASHGTEWHFIPPASPHFGGLWEAGVKSVKYHLKRVVGGERLTFEELATLLTQIEACLNSRPLCPITDDIDDLEVLTPAHFLIGEPLHTVPQGELCANITHLERWKKIQALADQFWKKWHSEYLCRLQQRPKWTKTEDAPKVGDLVLLKDERIPATYNTHPGYDGLIRVVTLKAKSGDLKRPITKICLLPTNRSSENTTLI